MTLLFRIPKNHVQRFELHNEVHARAPIKLPLPVRATHIALLLSHEDRTIENKHLAALCERFAYPAPKSDIAQFNADFDSFQLRWEQHHEFSTYTFYTPGNQQDDPFANPALKKVPVDWLAGLPGEIIVAAHGCITSRSKEDPDIDNFSAYFTDNTIIGGKMSGAAAIAFTDFRIHVDGFSRFLILDRGLRPQQAGRLLQRLFEIEVYRVMALLALPVVRQLIPKLNAADQQLLDITTTMSQADCNDAELLEELTQLAVKIENHISSTHFRTNGASAYYQIVMSRIEDLREVRIQGIQTIDEFMKRRLEPAINTCQSTAKRLSRLSERISNAGQLLRTRVDITIERQNQALLASMDRRAKLQLRLQETVEGLSIVAITTYIASLIRSISKAMQSYGIAIEPDQVVGLAILPIILIVAFIVRRIHIMIKKPNK